MIVKISDTTYINLLQLKEVWLRFSGEPKKYYWVFVLGYGDPNVGEYYKTSYAFETENEAIEWFEDKIEPYIESLNRAISSLHYIEDISVILDGIHNLLRRRL